MREVTVKLYEYSELSDKAKEKARDWYLEHALEYEWWDVVYEDAENIGLKIKEFDLDRGAYCRGNVVTSIPEVIEKILSDHGEKTETYKTAKEFEPVFKALEKMRDDDAADFDTKWDEAEREFLHAIFEDYRIMLQKEADYLTSDEAITEAIEANQYEFNEDGTRARVR